MGNYSRKQQFSCHSPELNVEETDWQADAQKVDTVEDTFPLNQQPLEEPELSDSELEKMRRKLEGLL
ncbi:hypothetical protein ANSO36C_38430 [Nostoc cf. commune SO-36]|uniref:Uncharacterized protein n=1 Tax=Nostoc cf. commune SO-36 TaxID=449208 RepID=A0ABN6Q750_NOSCO|nr:hypothetical protein ANSO36C_38430 [Nostoc cf. commune SO-36]